MLPKISLNQTLKQCQEYVDFHRLSSGDEPKKNILMMNRHIDSKRKKIKRNYICIPIFFLFCH